MLRLFIAFPLAFFSYKLFSGFAVEDGVSQVAWWGCVTLLLAADLAISAGIYSAYRAIVLSNVSESLGPVLSATDSLGPLLSAAEARWAPKMHGFLYLSSLAGLIVAAQLGAWIPILAAGLSAYGGGAVAILVRDKVTGIKMPDEQLDWICTYYKIAKKACLYAVPALVLSAIGASML